MQRYFLEIMFNGAPFHGWQMQNGVVTVQSTIEEALHTTLREEIRVVGCGRTDAGVHARQFFLHFDTKEFTTLGDRTMQSLNGVLPKEVAVKRIIRVNNNAHARFQAIERSYTYHIHTTKDPFLEGFSYRHPKALDLDAMNEACALLVGKRDFSSFCKTGSNEKHKVCDLRLAEWRSEGPGRCTFTITADRFLRNMVRAIVGTMIDVGLGEIGATSMPALLQVKDRSQAGRSVPACGLYLDRVTYPFIPSA